MRKQSLAEVSEEIKYHSMNEYLLEIPEKGVDEVRKLRIRQQKNCDKKKKERTTPDHYTFKIEK